MAKRKTWKNKIKLSGKRIFFGAIGAAVIVLLLLWEFNFFAGIPAGFPKNLIREGRIKITSSSEKGDALSVSYKSRLDAGETAEKYESYFSKKKYQNVPEFNSQLTIQNSFLYAKYFTDGEKLILLKIVKNNSSKAIITIQFGPKPENGFAVLPPAFPKESLPSEYFLISAEETMPQKGNPTFSLSMKINKNIFEVRDSYIDFFQKNGWEQEPIQEEKSLDPLTGASENIQYIWIRAIKGENVFVVNINRINDNNSLISILYGL